MTSAHVYSAIKITIIQMEKTQITYN